MLKFEDDEKSLKRIKLITPNKGCLSGTIYNDDTIGRINHFAFINN